MIAITFVATSAYPGAVSAQTAATACSSTTAPATTYGKVTQTVSVATAGTYRVWSRIKAPSTAANSYFFSTDANACYYNVGDSTSIPTNTWTWVSYKDGSTTTPIYVVLSAGTHTLNYIGREADVQLDKVMLLADTACTPTTFGDNCAVTDATAPAVSITAPAGGSTATGTVTINANATDASGVAKVDFLVDGVVKSTDTTAAYSYAWDSKTATNGSHTLTVKATDTVGNVGTSSAVTVNVSNATADTTAPSAPTGLASPTKTATSVALSWTASTDNVGVTGYQIFRGATQVGTTTAPTVTFNNTGLAANTSYSYTIKAVDAAGNVSAASSALAITTLAAADTSAPSVSLTASPTAAVIGATVTLTATATDNTGVAKVEFYNGTTLLNTDTTSPYSYAWVTTGQAAGAKSLTAKAYDAAGNVATSTVATATLTATTANTPGDVNGDGRVNAIDLSALITNDGKNFPAADFNKDGTVGAADMAILLSKWTW